MSFSLYDDLPSTSDDKSLNLDSNDDNEPKIAIGGWAKPSPQIINNNKNDKDIKSNVTNIQSKVLNSSNSLSTSTSTFIPSTVSTQKSTILFKPRSAAVSNNNNNNTSINISSNKTINNNIKTHSTAMSTPTILSTTTTIETIVKKLNQTPNNINNNGDGDEIKINDSILNNNNNSSVSFDIIDSYDPIKPNDYIKLCEERIENKRKAKLIEDNQLLLLEQKKQREIKEQEMLDAVNRASHSGDISTLHSLAAMGKGRGRGGVSNLPAWMTATTGQFNPNNDNIIKKDESFGQYDDIPTSELEFINNNNNKEILTNIIEPKEVPSIVADIIKRNKGLFSRPSQIVLLKNMVGAGEVDDQLASEVRIILYLLYVLYLINY